jgi:hypothetical protein
MKAQAPNTRVIMNGEEICSINYFPHFYRSTCFTTIFNAYLSVTSLQLSPVSVDSKVAVI